MFLRDASASAWNNYKQNDVMPINYVLKADENHTIYNWIEGFDETAISSWIDACIGVEEETQRINRKLEIYPNPFTTSVSVKLSGIDRNQRISLAIYSLSGKLIKTLSTQFMEIVTWDGKDNKGLRVEEGMYFLKFSNRETQLTEKIIVLK